MKKCKIDKCENKHFGHRLCEKHYKRWYRKNNKTHPLYGVWGGMKTRCYNKNCENYKYYGGRGIKVCDEWMNPKVFIEWCLENGWKKGLQIDRRDNDKGYCPENCWFVTPKENNDNQRLLRKDNTSGYRGVSRIGNKWMAVVQLNGKQKYLGCFSTKKEAARVYDKAVPDNRPRNFV